MVGRYCLVPTAINVSSLVIIIQRVVDESYRQALEVVVALVQHYPGNLTKTAMDSAVLGSRLVMYRRCIRGKHVGYHASNGYNVIAIEDVVIVPATRSRKIWGFDCIAGYGYVTALLP